MVRFILPEGYEGVFIVQRSSAVKRVITEELVLEIPESGILTISEKNCLDHWHSSIAEYSNGKPILIVLPGSKAKGLRYLSTDHEGKSYFLIGNASDEQFFHSSRVREPGPLKK